MLLIILSSCTTIGKKVEEYRLWNEVGNKQLWINNGIKNPKLAMSWKNVRVKYNEVAYWKEIGIATPKTLLKWLNAGYSKSNIMEYIRAGLKSPKEVAPWNKVENHIPTQLLWIKSGTTPKEASSWISSGLNDGYYWIKHGITTPKKAQRWQKVGVHHSLIPSLKNAGYNAPHQFKKICGKLVPVLEFSKSSPYKYLNQCIDTCIKIKEILSPSEIFGYIPKLLNSLDERRVFATAPKHLRSTFAIKESDCGVYKITQVQEIEIAQGEVKGNRLKKIF
jgi:hypothetical protein